MIMTVLFQAIIEVISSLQVIIFQFLIWAISATDHIWSKIWYISMKIELR